MSISAVKKTNFVHYVVVALLCFCFRFIPPFASLTPFGMAILGAFLGAIYGWMFIDMIYPSFLALVGVGISIGMDKMVTSSFSSTVISMIFIYLIIAVCNETGAINMLVNKLLSSKAMIGRPWFMIWLIFFAGICLGGLNSVVMIVIFLEFLATICKQVGIPFKSKTSVLMCLGTVYAISLGQIMIPFMGLGLTLVAVYSAMFQTTLEFLPWIAMILPLNLVIITAFDAFCFPLRCQSFEKCHGGYAGQQYQSDTGPKNGVILFLLVHGLHDLLFYSPAGHPIHHFLHLGYVWHHGHHPLHYDGLEKGRWLAAFKL